jgi:hypothetical protein
MSKLTMQDIQNSPFNHETETVDVKQLRGKDGKIGTMPDKADDGEPVYYLITESELRQLCWNGAGLTQEEQTGIGLRIHHRPIRTNRQHARAAGRFAVKILKGIAHGIAVVCREIIKLINENTAPPVKKNGGKKAVKNDE